MMNETFSAGDGPARSKGMRRLIWITGSNGISIAGFAGLLTLLSIPFDPGLTGLIAGILITGFAVFEIVGWLHLRRGQSVSGILWARRSQVGIFLTILVYSLAQLQTVNAESLLAMLSPEITQLLVELYQIDDWMLGELLFMIFRIVYIVLILTSAIYQGGLWWFYGRNMYHQDD